MQLVLREPVKLENLGPELVSIDRPRLAMSLDVASIRAPTPAEEARADEVFSAKISSSRSKISQIQSP